MDYHEDFLATESVVNLRIKKWVRSLIQISNIYELTPIVLKHFRIFFFFQPSWALYFLGFFCCVVRHIGVYKVNRAG